MQSSYSKVEEKAFVYGAVTFMIWAAGGLCFLFVWSEAGGMTSPSRAVRGFGQAIGIGSVLAGAWKWLMCWAYGVPDLIKKAQQQRATELQQAREEEAHQRLTRKEDAIERRAEEVHQRLTRKEDAIERRAEEVHQRWMRQENTDVSDKEDPFIVQHAVRSTTLFETVPPGTKKNVAVRSRCTQSDVPKASGTFEAESTLKGSK